MTLKLNWQERLVRYMRGSVVLFLFANFICHAIADTVKADVRTVRFDVPAGKAIDTLREAAHQADADIIFAGQVMKGVVTSAIAGDYSVQEAFELMLAGTPLAVFRHQKSGVFTVRKVESAAAEEIDPQSENTPTMNRNKPRFGKLLKGLLTVSVVGSPTINAQSSEADEEVFELSPFNVSSSEDTGYRATTTLAGTRLKTQIKDVGSAISVLTEELFEDTGATDAATVLSYALNTEVAGVHGNYSGNSSAAGQPNLSASRVKPQANGQRVRGLGSATLTRNYFLTDIPFDSYNTDRVTINRGPNSLLFGIGEPGGIINNGSRQASLSSGFGDVSFRIGERESTRFTIDLNRVLIEERLAVRLSALREEQNFQQEPAYEDDERVYFAFNSVLAKNEDSEVLGATILRGSYESGEIESTPTNAIGPLNSIDDWFALPGRSLEALTGTTLPGYVDDGSFVPKYTIDGRPGLTPADIDGSSLQGPFWIQYAQVFEDPTSPNSGLTGTSYNGFEGRILFNGVDRGRFDLISPISLIGTLPGFVTPTLPYETFDNENLLLTGSLDWVKQDFDATNLVFEQSFLNNKAGLELVFDRQNYNNNNSLPLGSSPNVRIDANEYIQVGPEGANGANGESDFANPNLGRAYVATGSLGSINDNETRREAYRATAFYTLDFTDKEQFSWLGSHTFTGLYTEQTIDQFNRNFSHVWYDDGTFDIQDSLFAPVNGFRRQAPGLFYLSDSLLGSEYQSTSDVVLGSSIHAQLLQPGESGSFSAWNRNTSEFNIVTPVMQQPLRGGHREQLVIESQAISMQSKLFDGMIVGLLGFRKDETEGLNDFGDALLVDGAFDPENLRLDPTTLAIDEGDTVTKSIVAHLPWTFANETSVSLHYNESENFSPAGPRRTILNNSIGAPNGETTDYGVTFDLMGGKIIARLNWFETTRNLAPVNTGALGSSTSWISQWLTRWQEGIDVDMSFEDAIASVTQDGALGAFPDSIQSYEDVFNEIIGLIPSDVQSNLNFRIENGVTMFDAIDNLAATNSFVTEGFEIELAGNLAPNWTVLFNLGQQETVQSNTAPDLSEFVLGSGGVFESLQNSPLAPFSDSPVRGFEDTFLGRYTKAVVNPLAAARARDGTVSQEQREWRANLTTNYRFAEESKLKGFGVGGAIRWQDQIATGYLQTPLGGGIVTPDLSNPYFGPDETNIDLWFSYARKLSNERYTWKSQLNIRNAFGSDDPIPVVTNPDGRVAVFRNPNPTEIFWTNTLSF